MKKSSSLQLFHVVCLVSSTVKEKLTADPDSEIATTSLRVSLLCPVKKPSVNLGLSSQAGAC